MCFMTPKWWLPPGRKLSSRDDHADAGAEKATRQSMQTSDKYPLGSMSQVYAAPLVAQPLSEVNRCVS